MTSCESTHILLDSIHPWIASKIMWITSQKFLTFNESVHYILESYQSSSWAFWIVSNLHWCSSFFITLFPFSVLWFKYIHKLAESLHTVIFVRKFALALSFYIYSLPHITKFIESFATILSRSQKLFVHKFFKIKHFFLESLCTLSHVDLLGCL